MDKQIVDIDGRKVVRVNDLRLDEVEGADAWSPSTWARGALASASGSSGAPHRRTQPPVACDERLHRLGGRRPGRDLGCLDEAARPARGPRRPPTRPTSPRSSTSSADATAPAFSRRSTTRPPPRRSRRWSPRPRSRCSRTWQPYRAADILEEMSPDDAADLVADLSETTREEILALMEHDEAAEVQELLGYPEDMRRRDHDHRVRGRARASDGRRDDRPAARARARRRDHLLRRTSPTTMAGWSACLSLRDLIVARPTTQIEAIMFDEPVAVGLLARGRGRPGRRALQPAGRAGRGRRRAPRRHRHRRRRDRRGPAIGLAPPAAPPQRRTVARA